ncbi:MAG: DUF4340 domain-containing protein [Sedimentisphaerales bacterium]|nr:DUF4340 domain-containing protein [Sedimentisphaerales bacterium]
MTDKKLSFLGILAIVSVIAAVFVWQFANRTKTTSAGSGNLIQGLDPAAIAEIVMGPLGAGIRRGATASQREGNEPRRNELRDEQINLARRGSGFVVANKSYYPASNRAVNDLLAACFDIRTVELYTEDKANHKDLGVSEEDARDIVKFLDSNGKVITAVVIGNLREDGSMAYARLINDDKVYIIYNTPWIRQSPLDYVEQELISVDKANIDAVTITSPNEVYTLISEANGTEVVLQQLPVGKKQKKNECDAVLGVLTNLRFDDVNAAADELDLNFDRQYTCLLKDSTLYTIGIAQSAFHPSSAKADYGGQVAEASADKKDSKTFIKCSAEFTDKTPIKKEQAVESEEELKKKEAKLLAKEKAKKFQETCDGWIYQIPEYNAKNMTRPMAELIEDIPPQKPAEANEPKEVKK